ncbi:hypothetical protein V6N11_056983 [Hibiscus sabdariffa]|uniref:Uncharacterized protein n=2 Tax=Hibiscus sabdariffa TaxID=183260 RepID=A0ABR2T5F0_9ROSI
MFNLNSTSRCHHFALLNPRLRGVLMLESTVANDEGVSSSTLSHSLINSANDWILEAWNEVLDSDVEEMRVLKVRFDEEFGGQFNGGLALMKVGYLVTFSAIGQWSEA